jgi:hypothetical protein
LSGVRQVRGADVFRPTEGYRDLQRDDDRDAFSSLWLSENSGTSSMGKMMALALLCTMAAAVFFQPLLMGPPRTVRG